MSSTYYVNFKSSVTPIEEIGFEDQTPPKLVRGIHSGVDKTFGGEVEYTVGTTAGKLIGGTKVVKIGYGGENTGKITIDGVADTVDTVTIAGIAAMNAGEGFGPATEIIFLSFNYLFGCTTNGGFFIQRKTTSTTSTNKFSPLVLKASDSTETYAYLAVMDDNAHVSIPLNYSNKMEVLFISSMVGLLFVPETGDNSSTYTFEYLINKTS